MKRLCLALAACCALPAAAAENTAFNPEISLILQGGYLHAKDIDERSISGFMPAGHDHGGERGFSLDHTELTLAANVDQAFRGQANFAIADDEVEVEEAWFQTLGLGHGLTLKAGRFLSAIGYSNAQHPHAWDFADQHLLGKALYGAHLIQDGVQARWLAPSEVFFELGIEAARGQFFPGSRQAGNRKGAGSAAAFVHLGDDLNESSSWLAGLSYLQARPRQRHAHLDDASGVEAHTDFTGTSKTWLLDAVWKWAPEGNPRARNLKLQAEYFRRTEAGTLGCADNAADGGLCGGLIDRYRARQSGFYAQGVYQFMPRWRIGYRYDRLDSGAVDFAAHQAALGQDKFRPQRHSLMVDFSPSEFSRLRLQIAQDKSMRGITDRQIAVQYVMSLGAHGAHKF